MVTISMLCTRRCGQPHDGLKYNGRLYCQRCFDQIKRQNSENKVLSK